MGLEEVILVNERHGFGSVLTIFDLDGVQFIPICRFDENKFDFLVGYKGMIESLAE